MAATQCLGPAQRRALDALIDTFFPALDASDIAEVLASRAALDPAEGKVSTKELQQHHVAAVRRFLGQPGSMAYIAADVEAAIAGRLNWRERLDLKLLLTALSTRLGTAAVLCRSPLSPAFEHMSLAERESGLLFLASSPLGLHNKAFLGLKRLLLALCLSSVDGERNNDYWAALGYTPLAKERPPNPPPEAAPGRKVFEQQLLKVDKDTELTVDCVIIGSGAGGGVAAATLAAAGHTVLVLEKGHYIRPADVTTLEKDGFDQMYEKAGLLTTSDGGISILAGATMGGGTTVNWACCIPTPDYVRTEWAAPDGAHRLPQFAPESEEYNTALAAVAKRISATEEGVVHNRPNQMLLDGAAALGWEAKATAQNFRVKADEGAGWTCFGDRDENKQGTLATYLLDAAAGGQQGGSCHFVECCAVETVTQSPVASDTPGPTKNRATGVVARVAKQAKAGSAGSGLSDGHWQLRVTARRCVILSAGSLHSPCVLLRSGLRNPNIGRHLHLHPVTGAIGVFQGRQMQSYKGAPMTTVCAEAERGPADDYYGSKLEVPSAHVGLMAACLPWQGGKAFKAQILKLQDMAALLVLCRDKDSGQVCLSDRTDPHAPPTIHYTMSRADSNSMVHGLERCFRIMAAAGADSLCSLHSHRLLQCVFSRPAAATAASGKHEPPDDDFVLVGGAAGGGKAPAGTGTTAATSGGAAAAAATAARTAELESFLGSVSEAGTAANTLGLFSAHQMGSCRMGHAPESSVVDTDGECWEVDDLYVMDASIFPTASGANPMWTTLAIAQMLSTRLASRLAAEDADVAEDTQGVQTLLDSLQLEQRRERRQQADREMATRRRMCEWLSYGAIAVAAAAAAALVALVSQMQDEQ